MKSKLFPIDWWLIAPVAFLVVIGLTVLFSINPAYFNSQLFGLGVSIVAFFLFSQFAYKDFKYFSLHIYLAAIILLVVVLLLGIESRGAVRWIEIFGVSAQLSEILKPFLSISFVYYLTKNKNKSIKTYFMTLLLIAPIVGLIHLQPDLGNALIYLAVGILTLVIYGIPFRWLGFTALPVLLASPFIWSSLHDYQRQRVLTFLNPMEDPQGSSYNLIQAVIAVGSGMVIGKGIGEGTQSRLQFLPENHTDFIFASLAEKLGFFGSGIVLLAFILLLWRIFVIYQAAKDDFGKLFAATVFLFILIHFFVNVGMNLGLVPVVGVTLPFVSFGGSSLLTNFISLGILSSISVGNRKREVLQIR